MDGGAWWAAVHGVTTSRMRLSNFTFTFHFHAMEKMATHSSVLAWRISGMAQPGGLLSMGSHRVGHDWSNLAAAAAPAIRPPQKLSPPKLPLPEILPVPRSCPRFWVTSLSFWLLFPVLSPCSYFLTWMLLKVPFSFSLSSLPSPTGMYVPTSTIPTLCERLLIFLFSTSSAFHNSRGTSLRVFQEEYSFSHLLPSSQSTPGTQLSVQHMFCE